MGSRVWKGLIHGTEVQDRASATQAFAQGVGDSNYSVIRRVPSRFKFNGINLLFGINEIL